MQVSSSMAENELILLLHLHHAGGWLSVILHLPSSTTTFINISWFLVLLFPFNVLFFGLSVSSFKFLLHSKSEDRVKNAPYILVVLCMVWVLTLFSF